MGRVEASMSDQWTLTRHLDGSTSFSFVQPDGTTVAAAAPESLSSPLERIWVAKDDRGIEHRHVEWLWPALADTPGEAAAIVAQNAPRSTRGPIRPLVPYGACVVLSVVLGVLVRHVGG